MNDLPQKPQSNIGDVMPRFSKEQVIAILEKRLEDAFANQFHRHEDARLREAIDTIEALVPPSCFPNGA